VSWRYPISLIASGTPEEIDKYVKDLLEKVKPGGGFILAPGVAAAPADTPIENINALIEAVENTDKLFYRHRQESSVPV